MTTYTLGTAAQQAIELALSPTSQGGGPGVDNANYLAAYTAIYSDLVAHGNIDPAVLYWFSQAGGINGQLFKATAAGTYIWNYTEAAAASEGATITNPEMQLASNAIANNVFQTLVNDQFTFSDSSSDGGPFAGNFDPNNILKDDASVGIAALQKDAPGANLDYAIWGGTLFSSTTLKNDLLTNQTYGLYNQLSPNTRDANAILAGFAGGVSNVYVTFPSAIFLQGITGLGNIDIGTLTDITTPGEKIAAGLAVSASVPLLGFSLLQKGASYIWDAATSNLITLGSNASTASTAVVYNPNATGSSTTTETLLINADGSGTFTDAAGTVFATYTAGQLTDGTIKINGAEIDAYNADGQLINSTQATSSQPLDKVYPNMFKPSQSDYIQISQAYDQATLPAVTGYVIGAQQTDTVTGLGGVAYYDKTTNTVVISYQGFNPNAPTSEQMLQISLEKAVELGHTTFNQSAANAFALSFAQSVAQQYPGAQIFVTGHDLGAAAALDVASNAASNGLTITGGSVFSPTVIPTGTGTLAGITINQDYSDPVAAFLNTTTAANGATLNDVGSASAITTDTNLLSNSSAATQAAGVGLAILDAENAANALYGSQTPPDAAIIAASEVFAQPTLFGDANPAGYDLCDDEVEFAGELLPASHMLLLTQSQQPALWN